MKLTAFTQYAENNPFNTMDRKEADDFIKRRNQQINNWRDVLAKSIEKNYGEYQDPGKEYFDFKPLERIDADEDEEDTKEKEVKKEKNKL